MSTSAVLRLEAAKQSFAAAGQLSSVFGRLVVVHQWARLRQGRTCCRLRRITWVAGRLTPAARVLVAMSTLMVPDRKAPSTAARSCAMRPAWWYARPVCGHPCHLLHCVGMLQAAWEPMAMSAPWWFARPACHGTSAPAAAQ